MKITYGLFILVLLIFSCKQDEELKKIDVEKDFYNIRKKLNCENTYLSWQIHDAFSNHEKAFLIINFMTVYNKGADLEKVSYRVIKILKRKKVKIEKYCQILVIFKIYNKNKTQFTRYVFNSIGELIQINFNGFKPNINYPERVLCE